MATLPWAGRRRRRRRARGSGRLVDDGSTTASGYCLRSAWTVPSAVAAGRRRARARRGSPRSRVVLDRDRRVLEAHQCLTVALTVWRTRPVMLSGMCSAATTRRFRRWKYACQSMASSLSLHACARSRCGHRDRGVAGAMGAQRVLPVVPLDEERHRSPILLAHTRGIMHIHQPLPSTSIRRCRFFECSAVAERVPGEVVVVLGVRRSGPHRDGAVDDLAHGVQVAALLQVEHLTADEHRALREPRHRERAQDRNPARSRCRRPEQDVRAVGRLQRLVKMRL